MIFATSLQESQGSFEFRDRYNYNKLKLCRFLKTMFLLSND